MKKLHELLAGWLETRTGIPGALSAHKTQPVTPESRLYRASAAALVMAFAIQAITGLLLAMYYSPSVTDAWGSVWYIHSQVSWGGFIRGIHYFGASAMVVVGIAHLVLLFVTGAYKKQGEMIWISAILILFMCFGFGLTGYLLPWDQEGYWASQVRTGIVGSLPVIGSLAKTLLVAGSEFGNLTLTRFYSLHVLVLPLLTVLFIWLHFRAMGRREKHLIANGQPHVLFWPTQAFINAVAIALVTAVVLLVAFWVEAPLQPPADPNSTYEARPEWYFLFLFQLLRFFEGPMTIIGTVILPGVGTTFLIALPFLDRAPEASLRHRKFWTALFASIFVFAGVLSAIALNNDANNEGFQRAKAAQEHAKASALAMAEEQGIDVAGRIPTYEGYKLFETHGCLSCHAVEGRPDPEERVAPDLSGYLSRQWFRDFLKNPMSPKFFGNAPAAEDTEWDMPAIQHEDIDITSKADIEAIVEWLAAQSGKALVPPIDPVKAAKGLELIEDEACSGCHSTEGEEMDGPILNGYGSVAWLEGMLRAPHDPMYFGERNTMPSFEDIPAEEMNFLLRYLQRL